MKLRFRTKLAASFLLVIITCGAVATVVGIRLVRDGIVRQAQNKVRMDINSARLIYEHAVTRVGDAVRLTAGRFFIGRYMTNTNDTRLASELERIRKIESLDVLTLADKNGTIRMRARKPSSGGALPPDDEFLRRIRAGEDFVAATVIVSREELLAEGDDLAARAHIDYVPTARAKPTDRTKETSGMMVKAAAAIRDADGNLTGMLCGGILLNRNYLLVDTIKDTVYRGAIYEGREEGTATIFQNDLRVSTNVLTGDGTRAIGTRVSSEVYGRVLEQGKPWIERAFVVNDWYITAYEPIRGISGGIIGILYVGMREKRYADMERAALLTFLGITAGGVVVSIVICLLLTKNLTRPMNELMSAEQRFASGDLGFRVKVDDSTAEMHTLGRTFNAMANSIQERDEELRRRAEEEIGKSERLALVGRLAAGVAHEINNPLGGILLFSNLLLKKTTAEGEERKSLQRIANEAERARDIVQGLLDFARQREPRAEEVRMSDVVESALSIVENQSLFQNIEIVRRFDPDVPTVFMDPSQMRQVFLNIVINAGESMQGKGTLTVSIAKTPDGSVRVSFRDTGEGIPQEALQKLFEPFFTTKEVGKGTGLGLSISHGIVESHGGTLTVSSTVGEGSEFAIALPPHGTKSPI